MPGPPDPGLTGWPGAGGAPRGTRHRRHLAASVSGPPGRDGPREEADHPVSTGERRNKAGQGGNGAQGLHREGFEASGPRACLTDEDTGDLGGHTVQRACRPPVRPLTEDGPGRQSAGGGGPGLRLPLPPHPARRCPDPLCCRPALALFLSPGWASQEQFPTVSRPGESRLLTAPLMARGPAHLPWQRNKGSRQGSRVPRPGSPSTFRIPVPRPQGLSP